MMVARKASRLPPEYQEVEWIESSESQYINTAIPFYSQETGCRIDAQSMKTGYFDNAFVGSLNPNFCIFFDSEGIKFAFKVGFGASGTFQPTQDKARHTFALNWKKSHYAKMDDISIPLGDIYFYNTRSPYIFCTNLNGFGYGLMAMRLYSASFSQGTEINRDFVPCYRVSDNKPGLYDLCGSICPLTNSPFYVNAGTGDFTLGPNV